MPLSPGTRVGSYVVTVQIGAGGMGEVYPRHRQPAEAGCRTRKWQVSTAGGTRPLWARDGDELFFLDEDLKRLVSSKGL